VKPEELSKAVEEYKAIYQKEFGIELSNEEATKDAQDLLQLFSCLTERSERCVK